MAKSTGLGDQLYVDGYNLSGDIGAIDTIGCPMEPFVVTGIDKSGVERIGGRRDGLIEFSAWFNPAANKAHDRLSNLPTTDVIASYFRGSTLGGAAAGMVAKQANYDPTRGDDGSLTLKTQLLGQGFGLDWGLQHTAGVATIGTAGAQASVDGNAHGTTGTTAFGLQAFLQVFAFTGTSATVAIQSSTDDAVGDPFANITGAVFTPATAPGAERIETGRTAPVERYTRVNVTGTFTLFWFAVLVSRNPAAVAF